MKGLKPKALRQIAAETHDLVAAQALRDAADKIDEITEQRNQAIVCMVRMSVDGPDRMLGELGTGIES